MPLAKKIEMMRKLNQDRMLKMKEMNMTFLMDD